MSTGNPNRRHFRMKFPRTDRPNLVLDGVDVPVIDISESGLKFKAPKPGLFQMRQGLQGTLTFKSGKDVAIKGDVVRIVGDLVMISFKKNLPLPVLKEEADRLLGIYGKIESAGSYF